MYYFRFCVAHVFDGERYRPFHSVQVVVDTHSLEYKQGGGDTTQAEFRRQVQLKKLFDLLDTQFRLLQVEQGIVVFGSY